MRLVRSVFSIRPLEIAFKSGFTGCQHLSSGGHLRGFIKKSVCNWAKDGYNLAERVPIAVPEPPYPKASALKWKKPPGSASPEFIRSGNRSLGIAAGAPDT